MKQGLEPLTDWCSEWAVEINVEKCEVMHMRRKGVIRTDEKFYIGGEEVKVVEEYKYLGCVVNEHLQGLRMVGERAKAGAGALGDWLRRCRVTVEEVKGSTFMKLMEMLVETVLLYGAEVWECGGQLRPVENVQMRAARIFLGVGRLHPLVSLQFEMNMLPVKWEAIKRYNMIYVNDCCVQCAIKTRNHETAVPNYKGYITNLSAFFLRVKSK